MSLTTLPGFPDPSVAPIIGGRSRRYRTPDGDFPSVTTILRVLGLGTEGLIAWSAREERKAVLEACGDVFSEGIEGGPGEFIAAVEERIGAARQHQKLLAKAAEVGTSIHQEIQRRTRKMLGLPTGIEPPLSDPALWAVMAWEDWLKNSGLRPVRCEQPVWDKEQRYAGTIDLLAYDAEGRLGIVDYKSSKGIYDDHHIQVAAYAHAAKNFAPIEWNTIVRVPKNTDDPSFETRPLGKLYDRVLTEESLYRVFVGARMVYDELSSGGR